jgi:hypothetical protein
MPSPASLASSCHSRSAPSRDNGSTQFQVVPLPTTYAPLQGTSWTLSSFSVVPDSVPFLSNSDTLLEIFRNRLAPQISFVFIPSHLRAEDLHRDKPMVYMSIMFAASYSDITTQQDLGKLILKYLAMKVMLEGKKRLDILQGLLIYIHWSVSSCFRITMSVSNICLGISTSVT